MKRLATAFGALSESLSAGTLPSGSAWKSKRRPPDRAAAAAAAGTTPTV